MKHKLISHAQIQEDIKLLTFLHDVDRGFYLDVGASDPTTFSVTKMFYNAGWSGINIEPLPDEFARLSAARPRDINLNAAAGDTNSMAALTSEGMFSHIVDGGHNYYRTISTSVRRVTDLVSENIDPRTPIHFCKIDVEGYEKETLEGIDFDVLRPWVFVIEANKGRNGLTARQLWGGILTSNGYKGANRDELNDYYVDERAHPELIENQWPVSDVLKHFEIYLSTNPHKRATRAARRYRR